MWTRGGVRGGRGALLRRSRAGRRLEALATGKDTRERSTRNRLTIGLYCTTALPIIVAVTSVAVSAARLHDLSPLAIIGRGYAMAKGEDGRVVSSVDAVARGDRLVVALSDGELDCTVNDVRRIHSAVEVWD